MGSTCKLSAWAGEHFWVDADASSTLFNSGFKIAKFITFLEPSGRNGPQLTQTRPLLSRSASKTASNGSTRVAVLPSVCIGLSNHDSPFTYLLHAKRLIYLRYLYSFCGARPGYGKSLSRPVPIVSQLLDLIDRPTVETPSSSIRSGG